MRELYLYYCVLLYLFFLKYCVAFLFIFRLSVPVSCCGSHNVYWFPCVCCCCYTLVQFFCYLVLNLWCFFIRSLYFLFLPIFIILCCFFFGLNMHIILLLFLYYNWYFYLLLVFHHNVWLYLISGPFSCIIFCYCYF